jgi:hypothetical protein
MALVVLTSVIFLSAYLMYVFGANIFQAYVFQYHLDASLIPRANIIAQHIAVVVLLLCTFKSLQHIDKQRWLMLALMFGLIIALVAPSITTIKSYPLLPGLSNVIFDLTEPWRQLYAPPAWRATIEGVTEGLAGFVDLASISAEDHLVLRLFHHHHYDGVIYTIFLLIIFAKLTHKIALPASETKRQTTKSFQALFKEYHYIFIASLLCGFNTAIFSYTFLLAKEVLPNTLPQYYQYCIYSGSIIIPMFMGRLGDKKGIFFMLILVGFVLALVKFINAGLFLMHSPSSIAYYVLATIEGGLAVSIWTLSLSLIGERLRNYGIFRSFALSNFIFGIGILIASRAYEYFVGSFWQTKLTMGIIDMIAILVLLYFYRNPKYKEHNI